MTATCHQASRGQGLSAGSSWEAWGPIFQMEGTLAFPALSLSGDLPPVLWSVQCGLPTAVTSSRPRQAWADGQGTLVGRQVPRAGLQVGRGARGKSDIQW